MKKQSFDLFIVDDDTDDLEFLREAIINAGLAVDIYEFEGGRSLLDHLFANPEILPDLIVLDLNMPVMDGHETLNRLRAIERSRSIPVIIFTTTTILSEEIRCFNEGCKHFYNKPNHMDGYSDVVALIASYKKIAINLANV